MINATLLPLLVSLAACCSIMFLVWIWAVKIKNGGVVDIFWSYNFPVIAIILLISGQGYEPRVYLISGMVLVWGIRLGTHLAKRVISHIHEEEGRYAQLRKEWAPHEDRKLFWFFQAQGISNVLLALPFFIITANKNEGLITLEYIGFALWITALTGEAVADWQLDRFKRNPDNKGKVCDIGLWYYSRHPNYFFEWMIWVSYFIFALGSPYGYWAVTSPAIILYLLINITGIPATEEQSLRSKGELFRRYQQTTSAFIPWMKKRG